MANEAPSETTPGSNPPTGEPAAQPADEKSKQLEMELDAARKRASKAEEAERKRAAAEKAAAEKKRASEEGAQKVLEEKQAELAALNEKLARYEAAEKERADRILKSLPDASRKKLAPFAEKLSVSDYTALLEAEAASSVSSLSTQPQAQPQPGAEPTEPSAIIPPPTGAPSGPRKANGDTYTPTEKATQMLAKMGRSDETLRKLVRRTTAADRGDFAGLEMGQPVFTAPFRQWYDSLTKYQPRFGYIAGDKDK